MDCDGLSRQVRQLWEFADPCVLCPRQCRASRLGGELGFCGIADSAVISSIGPHFGEEYVLVGSGGSGTIFFAGCNLGCVFCQNFDVSHQRRGRPISVRQLAQSMLELQDLSCGNINLVTPTHVAAPIAAAIEMVRRDGLSLPIVYNTGGYDSVETLKLLEGFVDIYMPDMKYADEQVAGELSDADDYPRINRQAVTEMHRQVGDLLVDKGVAKRGLLVRHLVLPNNLAGGFEIIDFIADEISSRTTVNVMDQYRPCHKAAAHPQISRRPTSEEFRSVKEYAIGRGLRVLE